jgi:preprotein translocase subunit SecY
MNWIYVGFIFFFCYFYTAVTFNPTDVPTTCGSTAVHSGNPAGEEDRIRGPGSDPDHFQRGGVRIGRLCSPSILITRFNVPFTSGDRPADRGEMALDTVGQIESHMLMRHYEGFMKQGRIKGRRWGGMMGLTLSLEERIILKSPPDIERCDAATASWPRSCRR